MKKITIIKSILVLFVLVIASCSNNDVEETFSQDISGIWSSFSFIANEPLFDVNNDGVNSIDLLNELPCRYSALELNSDKTFYQENNTWKFDFTTNSYGCTSGSEITKVNGTWKVNSNNTMLSLEVDGNTAFLEVEFDGETLKFNSSEILLNKNANCEIKNIRGSVSYKR